MDGPLAALAEDWGSVLSTNMAAHNPLQLQLQGIGHLLLASESTKHVSGAHVYIQAKCIPVHIKYNENKIYLKNVLLSLALFSSSPPLITWHFNGSYPCEKRHSS